MHQRLTQCKKVKAQIEWATFSPYCCKCYIYNLFIYRNDDSKVKRGHTPHFHIHSKPRDKEKSSQGHPSWHWNYINLLGRGHTSQSNRQTWSKCVSKRLMEVWYHSIALKSRSNFPGRQKMTWGFGVIATFRRQWQWNVAAKNANDILGCLINMNKKKFHFLWGTYIRYLAKCFLCTLYC